MRPGKLHPCVWGMGAAVLCLTSITLALAGPLSRLLRAAQVAESRRLVEAFQPALASARVRGDDLAQIDELKRIEQLPGVVRVRVHSTGHLQIEVTPGPWHKQLYRITERYATVSALLISVGALCGWGWQQRLKAFKEKWKRGRQRLRLRHRRARLQAEMRKTEELLPWVHQAVAFARGGLVLLDRHQSLVAFNRMAGDLFGLTPQILGSHWLDLKNSPTWAQALRQSLDHPGQQIPLHLAERSDPIFLLSFPALGSTWILV